MTLLLVAGIGVILAGLLAIGFGIPVKEFGFGNTLILTGTIGACTGLIMLSLAIMLRELAALGRHSDGDAALPGLPNRERGLPPAGQDEEAADTAPTPAESNAPLFSRDQPARADAASPPPWQEEAARNVAAAAAPEADEPKRRNLLFSSTRRERERAEAEAAATADKPPGEAAAPPKSFEEAWPTPERPRSDALRRAARAPTTFAEAAPTEQLIPERYVAPAKEEPAAVTVLKSGVVDGMAYSLYSDGSIEAQMPEGMMRFASIDELREHLDQRG